MNNSSDGRVSTGNEADEASCGGVDGGVRGICVLVASHWMTSCAFIARYEIICLLTGE
jgi:hypothetical protein